MGYELKTNTAYRLPVGPLVDPTDGKTAETSLTVTALLVQIYQMKNDGSAVVRASFNPTASGGNNDMALVTSSTDGMYDLEITAAQLNWLGNGRISLYDVDGFLVHYFDIQIVSANYFNNKYGSTIEQVNVTQWLTQACHAVSENGVPKVDLDQIGGVVQSLTDLKDLVDTGYDPTNHKIQSDLIYIHGSALTETAGQLAAAFVKLFDVATPLLVASDVMRGTNSANTVVPDAAGVAPTVSEIQTEMEENGASLLDTIRDYLENGTYGLSAIETLVDEVETILKNATYGLSAIRTRGDAAWITGGGGSISDILNVQPLIPNAIDLANTATVRIGLGLTNMLDDLPGTAEITPGTITIDHKAIGGTSWTNIVNEAACSELAGLIYYDEVFDSGTGYVAGDTIRITFKSQKIVVAANDYEITGTDGWVFHTYVREAMRGTDSAYTGTPPTVGEIQTEMEENGASLLDTIRDIVSHGTYGNSALKTLVDTNKTELDGLQGADGKCLISTDAQDLSGTLDVNTKTATATALNLILKDSTFALAIADAIWDEILTGAAHNIATSAGKRLRQLAAYAIHDGTAQAGNNVQITLAAAAAANDGIYNRNLLVLTGGTGMGQTRTIIDYNGTTKIAIIDREWRVNPDATSEYQIVADDTPLVVDQGVAQAGSTSSTIKLRAYASATDDIYLCNIIIIIAGTGRGQARLVGSYNGSTKVITLCGDNWTTTPDDTSVYVMIPYGATCASCVNDNALAQINAEVADVLKTDTKGEPAQGVPGATLSIEDKIAFMYKFMRNLVTNDGANIKVYNDAGAVVDHKSPVSEAGGVVSRGEFISGP